MKRLGFGLMRLPKAGGAIDIEMTARMADEFIKRGYTYFDTAYVYEGSEEAFREAVAKRHKRESYTLADKLPGWVLLDDKRPEDIFEESLRRCGVEYFDYYLLHGIQPSRMPLYERYGCWEFCRRLKAEGRIKNFGFSFHGDPKLLERLLCEHPEVDFVQLQINYLDWESGIICARDNYETCIRHKKPIVIMEPVKGGMLAGLREDAASVLSELGTAESPASYALRFAASLPGIMIVLSGMSAEEQMRENLDVFDDMKPLSDSEEAALIRIRELMLSSPYIGCTACRYCCEGCPQHINIPEIFKSVNELLSLGEHQRPHMYYDILLEAGLSKRASDCIACGQCEAACPQHLEIIELLKKASEMLDGNKGQV